MEQRVSAVTLGVADLDRARAFYERLGWKRGNDHPEIVFFQLPGMVLSLFGRKELADDAKIEDGSGFGGVTLAYGVRTPEEVDRTMAEVEAAGARILKPAEDAFWGGRSGYFADPDDHVWEVVWVPGWTFESDGGVRLGK